MPLITTTIGAYPKPKNTPINDWFLGTKSEEEKKLGIKKKVETPPKPKSKKTQRYSNTTKSIQNQ